MDTELNGLVGSGTPCLASPFLASAVFDSSSPAASGCRQSLTVAPGDELHSSPPPHSDPPSEHLPSGPKSFLMMSQDETHQTIDFLCSTQVGSGNSF